MKKVIYILFCFLCLSCVKEKQDRSGLIKTELESRVEMYKNKQLQTCERDLLEDINVEVDSIMYFLVQKMKGNSDLMPDRPGRPSRLVDTITLDNKPID